MQVQAANFLRVGRYTWIWFWNKKMTEQRVHRFKIGLGTVSIFFIFWFCQKKGLHFDTWEWTWPGKRSTKDWKQMDCKKTDVSAEVMTLSLWRGFVEPVWTYHIIAWLGNTNLFNTATKISDREKTHLCRLSAPKGVWDVALWSSFQGTFHFLELTVHFVYPEPCCKTWWGDYLYLSI